MNHTAEFVISHGYALLFFWILAEQGALPLPSVPLLLACGALVRAEHLNAAMVLSAGLAACLIADGAWFQIGRSKGSRILALLCRLTLEPDTCVRKTENGFVRYGVRFLLVSKFIPGMNALAGPLAGSSGVPWITFLVFDAIGAAIWIVSWCAVGFIFTNQLEAVGSVVGRAGFRLFLLIAGVTAAWIGWKYFQRRRFLKKLAGSRVTAEELQRMMVRGDEIVLIDVRGGLVAETDMIPGALRIPMEELTRRHKEVPRDRDVILFCT